MNPKTLAIFGGTGFIGTALCTALAREGYNLRIFTRHPRDRHTVALLPRTQLLALPALNDPKLPSLLTDCDAVINLIGILNEKGHDGDGFYRIHVDLTDSLIAASKQAGVAHFLHMSALGAHAETGASHYLKSKGQAQMRVHAAANADFRVTSFQPSVVFGEHDTFFNRFAKMLSVTPVILLPCADTLYAPVYVGDVVTCLQKALFNRAAYSQSYELCGPHTYSLHTLVKLTAHTLGIKRLIIDLNRPLSRLMAQLLEYFPGKPFSVDNCLSAECNSVCHKTNPLFTAKNSIEHILPRYLGPNAEVHPLISIRARRDW